MAKNQEEILIPPLLVEKCHIMEEYLSLRLDPNSPVPPITKIISSITEDQNKQFYSAAKLLNRTHHLNMLYSLVSVRELLELSPINIENKITEENINPVNSYRWLFLIYMISTNKSCKNFFLHQGKIEYIFKMLHSFICKADITAPYVPQLLIGIISTASRFISSFKEMPESFADTELFDTLLRLLTTKNFNIKEISIQDIGEAHLFEFCSPLPLAQLSQTNLFSDTTTLIHASILRLLYRVLKDKLPPNIETYREIIQPLCVNDITSELGQRVLIKLFNNNEDEAFMYTDTIRYETLTNHYLGFVKDSNDFTIPLSYKSCIVLSQTMSEISKIAEKHPKNWARFLENHPNVVKSLVALLPSEYDSEFILSAALLLHLGEAIFEDVQIPLQLFVSSTLPSLRNELSLVLLNHPDLVSEHICKIFSLVCCYGSRSQPFFDFLNLLCRRASAPEKIIRSLIDSLKLEFETIQHHPNSHIYSQLSSYIDVAASYLDDQPCNVCNNPQRPPSVFKLDDINGGQKFTHELICAKLKYPLTINTFNLKFGVKKRNRTPKLIKIYISSVEIGDVNSLLSDIPKWRHVADMTFTREATSSTITLPIQLFATCLKFHFVDFWEDASEENHLKCPQCHNEIVDKRSGICPKCKENAYHCRKCRHINYNYLDGFICSECGFSNFISMDWRMTATSSFSHTILTSSDDVTAALGMSDSLMNRAHDIFMALNKLKIRIDENLSASAQESIASRIETLNDLYNAKCKQYYEELTSVVQHVSAIRKSISEYLHLSQVNNICTENSMCYHCRATYIKNALKFLSATAIQKDLVKDIDDAPSLLITLMDSRNFTAAAVSSLEIFCSVQPELSKTIVELFIKSLPNPSPHLVQIICDFINIDDKYTSMRIRTIAHAITAATQFINANSAITPQVIAPLMSSICSSQLVIRWKELYNKWYRFKCWNHCKETYFLDPIDLFPIEVWRDLLTKCTNSEVRSQMYYLLKDASCLSDYHYTKIYDFAVKQLMSFEEINMYSGQTISLVKELLKERIHQLHAITGDLFPYLIQLLQKEANRVLHMEHSLRFDLTVGYGVCTVIQLLNVFFESPVNIRYLLHRKTELINQYIHIYFSLKSLIIQRSKFLDDTMSEGKLFIEKLINSEFELDSDVNVPNEFGIKTFLLAAADSIKYGHVSIVKAIANIVFPPEVALNFPILIRKARGQEDFIPGRMAKDPTMSQKIGKTMLDVKKKICRDLNMLDMLNDDNSMELLVDNNIISLELGLDEVYKCLWMPTQGETPMVVIFRLQGLDGEATEPFIQQIIHEQQEEEDPQTKYAYTTVLCEKNGFQPFFLAIKKDSSPSFIQDAIKLLNSFSKIKQNRVEMVRVGGIEAIFDVLKSIVNQEVTSSLFHTLIDFAMSLIQEDPSADKNPEEHIEFIFSSFNHPIIKVNPKLLPPFLALVPPLASTQALKFKVIHLFLDGLKPKDAPPDFNIFEDSQAADLLAGFGEFTLALPQDEKGNAFREEIAKEAFIKDAVECLLKLFPKGLTRHSEEWVQGIDAPFLPALLKSLAGMVATHAPTSAYFLEKGIISLLVELETVTSQRSIGELASLVLESAQIIQSDCAVAIEKERNDRMAQHKERAEQERKKALQMTRDALSPAIESMMKDIGDDEEGWECCICKEGYSCVPDEVLGFYVYTTPASEDFAIMSTHFVCVHIKCHNKARQSDRKSRQNSNYHSEWEAATVRNCERPCNAILPIPSCTLPENAYKKAILNFMENLHIGIHYAKNFIMELEYHLTKWGQGQTLDISKGGGSMPNAVGMLPFLIYNLQIFLDLEMNGKLIRTIYEQNLMQIISGDHVVEETFATSLALLTLEEWEFAKLDILKYYLSQRVEIANEEADEVVFQKTKPILVAFVITDKLQNMLKKPSGKPINKSEDGKLIIPSHKGEEWISDFMHSLEENSQALCNEYKDFGEEVEDEITCLQDIDTAFVYSNSLVQIQKFAKNGVEWVRNVLKKEHSE